MQVQHYESTTNWIRNQYLYCVKLHNVHCSSMFSSMLYSIRCYVEDLIVR